LLNENQKQDATLSLIWPTVACRLTLVNPESPISLESARFIFRGVSQGHRPASLSGPVSGTVDSEVDPTPNFFRLPRFQSNGDRQPNILTTNT